ncbi:hypothetical protein [Paractinoplanes brasiliensis]|uniref:WD40 repeat protein n=1 Tax=Paractinoplanes brasiliensis TaxID=52695 RepID=A0A4R6JPJ1_9ACTN|nr:hypothetical protein [Actinoplanes brasiliensis]TDO38350.1 hypothetical protein C8E87_2003 [Actinoplanes brasiliensis]GID26873.1 hypothetical protein Abr02nite_18560 [Actinoplanes brasiliensis]
MNNDEQQLRERLEAMTAPTSRLEAETLLQAGRRRSFRRRSWQAASGVALATGLVVAVPIALRTPDAPDPVIVADKPTQSAAAKVKCRSTPLPVPKGAKEATAEGVDPTGRYIIGHDSKGQDFLPILWTDGVPQRLPQVEDSVQLTTVNASGVVAGLATSDNEEYAFRYENGQYTRLKTPPGQWTIYPWPTMNAAGDIVINAEPKGNSGGKDSIALYWKAGTTEAVTLPLPTEANVYDITDDGLIVGGKYVKGEAREAYAWDLSGKGTKLDTPSGTKSVAYAVEGDWATGGLWRGDEDAKVGLWNVRTGKRTAVDGSGPGDAVNRDSWVVAAGAAYRDGKRLDLDAPKGQEVFVRGVSNTGVIVGVTRAPVGNEQYGPKTWKC